MSSTKYFIKVRVDKKLIKRGNKFYPHCKFYHSNNLISFALFCDKKFPEWCWFNVYDNRTKCTQLGSFTKTNRPTSMVIAHYEQGMW